MTKECEGKEEKYLSRFATITIETNLESEILISARYQSLSFSHLRAPEAADLHCKAFNRSHEKQGE